MDYKLVLFWFFWVGSGFICLLGRIAKLGEERGGRGARLGVSGF